MIFPDHRRTLTMALLLGLGFGSVAAPPGAQGPEAVPATEAELAMQIRAINRELTILREEVDEIRTTLSLLASLPIGEYDDDDVRALQDEVAALRQQVARMDEPPLIPPMPEVVETPAATEAGFRGQIILGALGVIGLLLAPFFAGMLWEQRHSAAGITRWEYHRTVDAENAEIHALGRDGWECVAVHQEQQGGKAAVVHCFKRIMLE